VATARSRQSKHNFADVQIGSGGPTRGWRIDRLLQTQDDEVGSRPATRAESFCPGAVITVISSSRRTAWLAATTASLAITMPLEGCRVPCTATTDLPTAAETSARSFESLVQIFSIQISFLVFCPVNCSMKELLKQAHPPFG
jgi:hypothetical protein